MITGIGLSTSGTKKLSQTLHDIAETGAQYAELSLYQEPILIAAQVNWEYVRQLHTLCRSYSLEYTAHGPLCTNLMDREHLHVHKNVLRSMINVCNALECRILVVHAGKCSSSDNKAECTALERDALSTLGDEAFAKGITLAVETLYVDTKTEETSDPIELAQTLSAINHRAVCATLDFSHAFLMTAYRGLDYSQALITLAPWVNHLHLHDSFGISHTLKTYTSEERLAYGVGDLHLPLGWGSIPWQTLLPQLNIRPQTVMMIELPQRWWSERQGCINTAMHYKNLLT